MDNIFKLLDIRGYLVNQEGRHIIETSNTGIVIDCSDTEIRKPAYLDFPCPCGHGRCNVRIAGGPADDGTKPKWKWNGDLDKPTLIPSINCLACNPENPNEKYAGCGWHGYITNGIIQ